MRTITVQQPWAWAIAVDDPFRKDVENRTFKIATGELLIHAGQRWSERGADFPLVQILRGRHPHDATYVANGEVIARVHVECHEAAPGCCDSPWAEESYTEHSGRVRTRLYHWVTVLLEVFDPPIPARGRQGVWDFPIAERVVG